MPTKHPFSVAKRGRKGKEIETGCRFRGGDERREGEKKNMMEEKQSKIACCMQWLATSQTKITNSVFLNIHINSTNLIDGSSANI